MAKRKGRIKLPPTLEKERKKLEQARRRLPSERQPRKKNAPRLNPSQRKKAPSDKVTKTLSRSKATGEFFDPVTGRLVKPREARRRIGLAERVAARERQLAFWVEGAKEVGRDENEAKALVKKAFQGARTGRRPPGFSPADARPLFDMWFQYHVGGDTGFAEEWRRHGT